MNQKEFEYEKELLKIELSNAKEKHKFHMIELEFQKELENTKHENEKERQRIKSAEIKRSIDRKQNRKFVEGYIN